MSSIYSSNLPYTYLIGWSNLNTWYYGRRTAKNCHPAELWKKYFTSSDEVARFRKEHGEPDIIQIRKTFTDPKKCSIWECRLLEKIDAQHDPRFLNKRNGDYKWDTTGVSPSEEARKRQSEKLKNRIFTTEHKQKLKAPKTESHKQNMRKPKPPGFGKKLKGNQHAKGHKSWAGKNHKPETKQKLSIITKNEPKLCCIYCRKAGNKSIMHRWHMDNCKHKN